MASPLFSRRILGVDPALHRTGWAALDGGHDVSVVASGVIAVGDWDRGRQLSVIYGEFRQVIERTHPDAVCLEKPGTWQRRSGTRGETVEALAMSRGVMLLACMETGVCFSEVDFREVRRCLLGKANAPPRALAAYLEALGFPLPRRPRGSPDLDIVCAVGMAHRAYNLALLDLGATVCRYDVPKCSVCPLAGLCDSAIS